MLAYQKAASLSLTFLRIGVGNCPYQFFLVCSFPYVSANSLHFCTLFDFCPLRTVILRVRSSHDFSPMLYMCKRSSVASPH